MLKRIVVGLILGVLMGAAAAAALVKGLGVDLFAGEWGALMAYAAAAVTGVLTGLVAGKPIWAQGGKLEAGLKAFFGALLAAAAMFALRRWAQVSVDLSALQAGAGPVGDLPAASLPVIGGALGALFELDNTPDEKGGPKPRVAGGRVRVEGEDEEEEESDAHAEGSRTTKRAPRS